MWLSAAGDESRAQPPPVPPEGGNRPIPSGACSLLSTAPRVPERLEIEPESGGQEGGESVMPAAEGVRFHVHGAFAPLAPGKL